MRKLMACLVALVATTAANAAPILYFSDFNVGTDQMAAALASPEVTGQHTVTTAASLADFTTMVQSGNFALVIFGQQNQSGADYDAAWAAVATHIANGGRAIGADWTGNNTHSAAFGAAFTGDVNQTEVTVTDGQLDDGIINPITLTNPGWGVFSTGLNGSSAGVFGNGQTAIVYDSANGTIFNGFLFDTPGLQGRQLFINEINLLLTPTTVPEPISLVVFGGLMVVGAGAALRRRMAKKVVA